MKRIDLISNKWLISLTVGCSSLSFSICLNLGFQHSLGEIFYISGQNIIGLRCRLCYLFLPVHMFKLSGISYGGEVNYEQLLVQHLRRKKIPYVEKGDQTVQTAQINFKLSLTPKNCVMIAVISVLSFNFL